MRASLSKTNIGLNSVLDKNKLAPKFYYPGFFPLKSDRIILYLEEKQNSDFIYLISFLWQTGIVTLDLSVTILQSSLGFKKIIPRHYGCGNSKWKCAFKKQLVLRSARSLQLFPFCEHLLPSFLLSHIHVFLPSVFSTQANVCTRRF